MKKLFILLAAAALCACAGTTKKATPLSEEVWNQDPVDLCAALIEHNQKEVAYVRANFDEQTTAQVAQLYQELDLQSNAICRSRMARRMQVEQLKELRQVYQGKINLILAQKTLDIFKEMCDGGTESTCK